jgi:hypothetical protein
MISLLSFLILALAAECYANDPWRAVVLGVFALMLWSFPVATILMLLGLVILRVITA